MYFAFLRVDPGEFPFQCRRCLLDWFTSASRYTIVEKPYLTQRRNFKQLSDNAVDAERKGQGRGIFLIDTYDTRYHMCIVIYAAAVVQAPMRPSRDIQAVLLFYPSMHPPRWMVL